MIVVQGYDPAWPEVFEQLRSQVWGVVGDFAVAIEHVGSTAVPGLAAKPIIDMSVVVPTEADVVLAIKRLSTLGYVHRGNLGVEGREAFDQPLGLPTHHLYVCPQASLGLRNHLAVRDYLRRQPESANAYSELKRSLAGRYPNDIDAYIDGKTDFILAILAQSDLSPVELADVERVNRKENGGADEN